MKLELPCPILLPTSFAEAARRMGISVEDVERIAWGSVAYRDGELFEPRQFEEAYPTDAFDDFTGDAVFPDELLTYVFEVPRDPQPVLTPPISGLDRAAADASLAIRRYRRLKELGAPGILLSAERANLRRACDPKSAQPSPWQPMHELMTGAAVQPGAAGEAHPMFGVPGGPIDPTLPVDVAWLDGGGREDGPRAAGWIVFWPYATLVFGQSGSILDVFPTRGLRAIGGDAEHVGFVCGGGRAASSGYFGAELFVRDLRARAWLPEGAEIPPSLPRFVAGTVRDVRWAVVVDTREGVGYRTSPRASGDQCGETFSSACGRFVWDRGRFVLEAATGEAVLDAAPLTGFHLGFAKTEAGFRFLMQDEFDDDDDDDDDHDSAGGSPRPEVRIKDETDRIIRTLEPDVLACALSADGTRLVSVTANALRVCDTDSGQRHSVALDLTEVSRALRLPNGGELWQNLAAAYGLPSALRERDLEEVRAPLKGLWRTFTNDELTAALCEARAAEPLPLRVGPKR